jgi:hypothetical protein
MEGACDDPLNHGTAGPTGVLQIIALERELAPLDAEIARQEREINALVYGLYGLGAEEIEMVEKG